MVVISDVTQQLVDVDFYMHSLGEQRLKGISRPVEVFAVERPRYAAARFEAERYRKAGLVGRDEPRDRAARCVGGVRRDGRPAPARRSCVVGEAGIGKSRLVAEVLDRVEASAGRVLGAGCLPYYANVSLWPIARMLERVARQSRARRPDPAPRPRGAPRPRSGSTRARSVPFLGPLLGVAETPDTPRRELDPSAFLDETLARLVEWLSALGRRTPAPARRRGPALGRPLHAGPARPARRPAAPAASSPWPPPATRGDHVAGCRPRPRARPARRRRVHDPRRQPLAAGGTSPTTSAPPSSSRPKGSRCSSRS